MSHIFITVNCKLSVLFYELLTTKLNRMSKRLEISNKIHELAYNNMTKDMADKLTEWLVDYADAVKENYNLQNVSNRRGLLIAFKNYLRDERRDVSFDTHDSDEFIDDFESNL